MGKTLKTAAAVLAYPFLVAFMMLAAAVVLPVVGARWAWRQVRARETRALFLVYAAVWLFFAVLCWGRGPVWFSGFITVNVLALMFAYAWYSAQQEA